MKQRPRIYYTEADKLLMWNRWQKAAAGASSGECPLFPNTSRSDASCC